MLLNFLLFFLPFLVIVLGRTDGSLKILTLFMGTSIHRIWKPDTRKQDGRWQKLQKKGQKKFTLNTLYNVLNILH